MQDNFMQQGIELMLYGMGTVFTFLVLLIIATTLMSALLLRYAKPMSISISNANAPAGKPVAGPNDDRLVAVISAAIHQYRSRK